MADYNINAATRRVVLSGSAGTGPYSFTFAVLVQTDLAVYLNSTKLTLTTDYTVSISANGTGSVTLNTGTTNVPTTPTSSDSIIIVGARALERTTDFVTAGDLRASALNEQLDANVIFDQQLAEENQRTVKAPVFDPATTEGGGTVDMTLPAKDTRKGKYLAFNDTTGNPEAGPSVSDVTTVSAAATDIALLADIQDGTTATNAITTVAANNANVTTVAGISGNVTTVAGISSDVTTVASDTTDIGTVSSNISNVNTVAGVSANVTTVAGISSNVTTVAGISSNVTAVANDATDIGTVATNIADVNTAASNITDIQNASTNAATATTKASEAATSATNAASSATAAASSATAAASSQTAAAASAASAASAFDNFDDTYLGSKTSDPTVDNDGDPLTSGDLYFNSTANEMRVYDGANWIAATSAGNVSLILYEYTATAGQTTFSGSDDNSATLSYTVDNLQVVMNGVVLDPADFTATNGTSVVLDSGATVGDQINIYAFKSFTTADMVSKTAGGTFSGAVGFGGGITGDVTIDDKIVHAGDTNTAIRFPAADTVTIETAGSERVRVDSSGNVGINTSSAAQKLHLQTGGTTYMRSENTGISTVTDFGTDSTGSIIINRSAKPMRFFTDSAERVRIDSSGNVAIGATSTSNKLEVRGVGLFSSDGNYRATNSGVLNVSPNGNLAIGFGGDSDANYYAAIFHNSSNTAVGSIFVDASSTTYATSSDYRLKENVAVLTGAIERVKALAPKRFNFIAEPDRTMDGFLAHEAAAVVPEAVQGEKDAMSDQQFMVTPALGDIITPATDDADEVVHSTGVVKPDTLEDGQEWRQTASPIMETRSAPDYQGIDQAKLVPLLTAALQEAIAKIETLETKVAALEAE
jgi:hypothetical protein